MRKPDNEVKEVTCYDTGKPMPKIPLWMSDITVKFISDEAKQRHPNHTTAADFEPIRRPSAASAAKGEPKDTLKTSAEPDAELDEAEDEDEEEDEDNEE